MFNKNLEMYEKALLPKVSWEKPEGFNTGKWQVKGPPGLPGGLKYLGVCLGTEGACPGIQQPDCSCHGTSSWSYSHRAL